MWLEKGAWLLVMKCDWGVGKDMKNHTVLQSKRKKRNCKLRLDCCGRETRRIGKHRNEILNLRPRVPSEL